MTTTELYIGDNRYITFDIELCNELVKSYDEAVAKGDDSLIFEEEEFSIEFAKHAIDYLRYRLSSK